jgi:2-haloacid dehalogenase
MTKTVENIKVLAFDVFGTVVDWRSSVIAEGEQLGATKGLDVDYRQMLEETLVKFEIDCLSEEEIDDFNRAWHRLKPWRDSVPGLQRLKSRFVITTLSNGNISLLTNMAKHAGLPWDCILSAENVKRYKPHPEVYLLVPQLFDLAPNQVMMVAAHEHDLQSARKHGLRTAYVHRPAEHGPEKTIAPSPPDRFDVYAKDFFDLADQLGC